MSDAQSFRDNASTVSIQSNQTSTSPVRRMSRSDGPGRRTSVSRRPSFSHQSTGLTLGRQALKADVKYENTYRIEPDEKHRFQPSTVCKILASLLESFLDGELYESLKCSQIAQNLTEVVKGRMKELTLPRYKFVSHVVIGQNCNQGINYASRCVWNTATDNSASATYRNGSLFAVATVFALYFE